MPVPGYDPDDLDDALESHLDDGETEALLAASDWRAYRDGDANLVDLLDDAEIERLLAERGESTDAG